MKHVLPFLLLLVSVCCPSLLGQEPKPRISMKCDFTLVSLADWSGDVPKLKHEPAKNFSFVLDSIDPTTDSARMIGNQGSETLVLVMKDVGAMNFIEVTPSGAMNVTSLFGQALTSDGEIKAVHSRHVVIGGEPVVSQYYGTCRPWN